MHYSPRNLPERDPEVSLELRLIFLSLPLSPPRAPAAAGCLLPMIACQGPSRIGGRLAAVFNNNKPYLLLLISPTAGANIVRTRLCLTLSASFVSSVGTEWVPRSLRWNACAWRTHSARLNVRQPMAALKTLPVRFLQSTQYRRLHQVQPGHATPSSLSVEHRPAVCAIKAGSFSQRSHEKSVSQLGWRVETPRPPLAVCCLSRVPLGSVETYAEPSHVEPLGRGPRTVGVGERTLPLERRSVFEGLACCCDGPASVSASDELPLAACVAAEEPVLLLRHVQHLLL